MIYGSLFVFVVASAIGFLYDCTSGLPCVGWYVIDCTVWLITRNSTIPMLKNMNNSFDGKVRKCRSWMFGSSCGEFFVMLRGSEFRQGIRDREHHPDSGCRQHRNNANRSTLRSHEVHCFRCNSGSLRNHPS